MLKHINFLDVRHAPRSKFQCPKKSWPCRDGFNTLLQGFILALFYQQRAGFGSRYCRYASIPSGAKEQRVRNLQVQQWTFCVQPMFFQKQPKVHIGYRADENIALFNIDTAALTSSSKCQETTTSEKYSTSSCFSHLHVASLKTSLAAGSFVALNPFLSSLAVIVTNSCFLLARFPKSGYSNSKKLTNELANEGPAGAPHCFWGSMSHGSLLPLATQGGVHLRQSSLEVTWHTLENPKALRAGFRIAQLTGQAPSTSQGHGNICGLGWIYDINRISSL